jgi:uncharacterized protein (DUF2252 family)
MPAILARIQKFNANRIPKMVQLKYKFMQEDPFRFFRGTCHLFYEDLAENINWEDKTRSWICGDLHLENFGSYKGDNRVVYFDLNDFDEAILAPISWELVRMLTSIRVATKVLDIKQEKANLICKNFVETYIAQLKSGKALSVERKTAKGLLKVFLKKVANRSDKQLVKERTIQMNGRLMLHIDNEKFFPLEDKEKKNILKKVNLWNKTYYGKGEVKIHDAAYRIAGTGSIGAKRYVVLKEIIKTGYYHLIDIKESLPSSLDPYVKIKQPKWKNEAERVRTVQNRAEYITPAWLHNMEIDDVSFIVKELQPMEDKMDLRLCKGNTKKIAQILNSMAILSASAALRCSGRQGSSNADKLIAFAGNTKSWKSKVLNYAEKYGSQVVEDYNAFKKELKDS